MAKYHAIRTTIDGITFASKKEAARYQELKLMVAAHEITMLQLQVKYSLDINDVHICNYFADFVYTDSDGFPVVEDVKGVRTAVYKLKKKLMLAIYEIRIYET